MVPPLSPALAEQLRRWRQAGLIDGATEKSIAVFEARHQVGGDHEPVSGATPGLLARLLLTLGAVLLAAGLLLFISAHWQGISPASRFGLVIAMVIGLHGLGVWAGRGAMPGLATALHGVGTVAFGAGVYLTAQIFHLPVQWPPGLLLWSLGAGAGWVLLRQWPQLALLAVLLPAWLVAEFSTHATHALSWFLNAHQELTATELLSRVLGAGALLLSLTYLGAASGRDSSAPRRVLLWVGGLAFGPASVAWASATSMAPLAPATLSAELARLLALGWVMAIAGPLLLGWRLRGRRFWPLAVALGWMRVSMVVPFHPAAAPRFGWWVLGGVLLALWGARDGRAERVNLGAVVVAITLIIFYFSAVFDKLERSVSLIGLGVLFLLGGWLLERFRRQLVERIRLAAPPPPLDPP
ncbi:MAG: DUF2157 domain-containing protein [Cyanobacteriota bacterium]